MGGGKCNLDVRQAFDLPLTEASLCIRARPCHLTFPLSFILQTLLATKYWFLILLNILLPLIEFTPDYQSLKEASPPRTVVLGYSHPRRGHTPACPPLGSVVSDYLREKTWKMTTRARMKIALAVIWRKIRSSRGESVPVFVFLLPCDEPQICSVTKRLSWSLFLEENWLRLHTSSQYL